MFDGLNAIPWYDLKHAYGSAEEVPMWLRQLTSSDEHIRKQAMNHLAGSICHQGWICPATAYAVPYLLELLQEPTVQIKEKILELLADIAIADPQLHEERWRKNPKVPSWEVPAHIPFKDAHLEVSNGLSIYVTLLEAIDQGVRMQAANVLKHTAKLTPDLQARLITLLKREPELKARANLVLLLGALSHPEPEAQAFFADIVQAGEDDLIAFCAALAVAQLAKDETPQEVIQLLANVMIRPPEKLETYGELPCRQGTSWRAAALALGNLRPERLQTLTPALQEELLQAEKWRAMTLAEMLLFIYFSGKKLEDQKQWTQAELMEQQRTVLSLLCDRSDLWGYDFLLRLPDLLKAYGLPDGRKVLADFLKRELPAPAQRTPPLYEHTASNYRFRHDAFRDHLRKVFREQLSKVYPEIRVRRMGGMLADDLLQVNDDLLFRIPDSPAAVSQMEREHALLRFLQGRVPLPIPNPLYMHQSTDELGQIFMGYLKLPGKPLYKEMLESVEGEEVVETLALQIASFLHALHHTPLTDLAGIALPVIHGRKSYESLYARVRQDLFPHLQPDLCEQIAANFETFLDTPQNFALTPVLVHGSFGPHRILYDAKNRSISGVIGFTQAGLGDPASDFAMLLGPRGYGKNFVQRFERVYPDLPTLQERMQFYANASILQEAFSQFEQESAKKIAHKLKFSAV